MLIYCNGCVCNGCVMRFTGRAALLAKPTTTTTQAAPEREPMREPMRRRTVPEPTGSPARWIEPYHDPRNPRNARTVPTRRFERQKNHARRIARRAHPRNAER